MRLFGLIGYPLTHSFSKRYFSEKFEKENIQDASYVNFEIPDASEMVEIVKNNQDLKGMNVTIPHKQTVLAHLDRLDESAKYVGAVNVIKVEADRSLTGYNSDYYGFMQSLQRFLPMSTEGMKALILGTGGAAKAVEAALKTLHIPHWYVSRERKENAFSYDDLAVKGIETYQLIINTSPLGMYPNVDTCPQLPYDQITSKHYLFDLVYNPETTLFMQKGLESGAKVKNGLEMLHLQAEKAWEIWNQ